METIEFIIGVLSEACFIEDINVARKVLHKSLLYHIKEVLLRNNFDVHLEEPLEFDYFKMSDGSVTLRQGYIDLVAKKEKIMVGVEFDSGSSLKHKSIEKLIQSPCDTCIGIVKGNAFTASIEYNIQQIKHKLLNVEPKKKTFWLIDLSQKFIGRMD